MCLKNFEDCELSDSLKLFAGFGSFGSPMGFAGFGSFESLMGFVDFGSFGSLMGFAGFGSFGPFWVLCVGW